MYASNQFEQKILNVLRNTALTAPSALYLGLFLTSPTETGTAGQEANYPSYARQRITFSAPATSDGQLGVKNSATINFPESVSDAGQFKFIGIFDAATNGNMWLYGELSIPLDIKARQMPSVFTGDIFYYIQGDFSTYFKTKILNVLLGQTVAGITPRIALYNGDPDGTGTELSGSGYARTAITFGAPAEQSEGQATIVNSAEARFPVPLASWGYWAYFGIVDSVTGGNLFQKMNAQTHAGTIERNYVPCFRAGDYKISIN